MEDPPVSGNDVCQEALDNILILRKVLLHLSVSDLLNCSVVCKLWNCESRLVLRDHKKCFVALRSSDQCLELLNLSTCLARINVVPFNGVLIDVDIKEHFRCVGVQNLNTNYDFLLNHFPLKYLTVEWAGGGEDTDGCPIMDLIDKMLVKNSATIEELKMCDPPRVLRINRSFQLKTGEIYFPSLKILHLNEQYGKFDANLVCGLTSAAPNLQEISGLERTYRIRMMVPQNKYHLVKDFWVASGDAESEETFIRNFASAQPSLRKIMIEQFSRDLSDVSRAGLKLLLGSSRLSLQTVQVGASSLVDLIRCGIPPLENVRSLELYLDVEENETQIRVLQDLNFPKHFPRLESIYIAPERGHHDGVGEEIHGEEQGWNQVSPGICSNVRQFRLQSCPLSELAFRYFTEIFPNVSSFEWVLPEVTRQNHPNTNELYRQVWSAWPFLERVKLYHSSLPTFENFDWLYCGIHPEEARELQAQNFDFLDAVHIVPIQPALTSLQRLNVLTIKLDGEYFRGGSAIFVSKVTGLIAFSRMPGLTVNIDCSGNFGVQATAAQGQFPWKTWPRKISLLYKSFCRGDLCHVYSQ